VYLSLYIISVCIINVIITWTHDLPQPTYFVSAIWFLCCVLHIAIYQYLSEMFMCKTSSLTLRPNQPSIKCVMEFIPGIKLPQRDVDYWPPSCADAKNIRIYNFISTTYLYPNRETVIFCLSLYMHGILADSDIAFKVWLQILLKPSCMLLELLYLRNPSQDINLDRLATQRYRNDKNMSVIKIIIIVVRCHFVNPCMIQKRKSNRTA